MSTTCPHPSPRGKNRRLTIAALASAGAALLAPPPTALAEGEIDRVEYFIDVDPGVGLATPVPIGGSPVDSAVASLTIPVDTLEPGRHFLHVRARDLSGRWSLPAVHLFRVDADPSSRPLLGAGEWFLDEDPGLGAGTPLGVPGSSSAQLTETVPLGGVLLGRHLLGTRWQDARGHWSPTSWRPFAVDTSILDPLPSLSEIVYQIEPVAGDPVESRIPLTGSSFDDLLTDPLAGLTRRDAYRLNLLVTDVRGRASYPFQQAFRFVTIEDLWHEAFFTPVQEADAALTDLTADLDGDGLPGAVELALVTDPFAANDPFTVDTDEDGNLLLTFDVWASGVGTPGVDYTVDGLLMQLLASDDLSVDSWEYDPSLFELVGAPRPNGDGSTSLTVRVLRDTAGGRHFFRMTGDPPASFQPFALFVD